MTIQQDRPRTAPGSPPPADRTARTWSADGTPWRQRHFSVSGHRVPGVVGPPAQAARARRPVKCCLVMADLSGSASGLRKPMAVTRSSVSVRASSQAEKPRPQAAVC